jgi:hypothetical protein
VDVYNVAKTHSLPSRELIFYALPGNVVHIEVPITQTLAKAADCKDDAFLDELGLKRHKAEPMSAKSSCRC